MKKFGTPMGAGPGSENEKVGFDGVGTPFLETGGGVVGLVGLVGFDFFEPGAEVGPWCELGWLDPGPVVFGAVLVPEGEVEVEPEPPECDDPDFDPDGVELVPVELAGVVEPVVVGGGVLEDVVVVAGVVVVVVVGCGQVSETLLTGTERLRDEIGAPGGSWK